MEDPPATDDYTMEEGGEKVNDGETAMGLAENYNDDCY